MSEVVLRGLTKSFKKTTVVSSVDLQIHEREFLSIVGSSGCGKTTTLRMIAGFETPDNGRIFFDNLDVTDLPPNKRKCGFVFQNYALWPHLSVYRNISMGLELRRENKTEICEKVLKALELVRLSGYEDRFPGELSGGQQQRVSLARAIVLQPKVLLLDEPLSSLDRKLRKEMQVEIKLLQENLKLTTIYVTHDQEEAMSMSDRVVVMNSGKVEQIGSPVDVYCSPANDFVARFLGEADFFEVCVSDIIDGETLFTTEQGSKFLINTPTRHSIGNKATLFVRPENVQIVKVHPTSVYKDNFHWMPGVVEHRIFLGDKTMYHVKLDDSLLIRACVSDALAFERGMKVSIGLRPQILVRK